MISIIIPTLNEENYLPQLLESIKRQDFTDYEIIIADGGSFDATLEIAKRFACRVIGGGLPAQGRNEGAKIAKGDLLLFVDADSTLPPNFLSQLIGEFKKRKLDLASLPVYPQGNIIDKFLYWIYNTWANLTQRILAHATQTILIKREIHQKIGGFDLDVKIGEDHAYARAGAKVGRFGFLNKVPALLTSARRFECEGRLRIYTTYILAGFYMFFLGKIKADIFKYYSQEKRLKKWNNNKLPKVDKKV